MHEKQEILFKYFRNGDSKREISRKTGLHRNTVDRYIKEYQSKFINNGLMDSDILAEELTKKPIYNSSNRIKRKMDIFLIQAIEALLEINKERRGSGKHKQQYKKVDIHEEIQNKGFNIGYSSICNMVNKLENKTKEAFIRQVYNPGISCEFDWGEVKVDTSNGIEKYQMAVFSSCYSNYRYACLFKKQDTNSFQQAHVKFFSKIGGVFKELIYDNMKVAVKSFVGPNEKEPTDGLLKLSMYYNFSFRFCNARKGNEKGHVEKSVEYVRRKAFAFKDEFKSLSEANIYLEEVCDKLNNEPKKEHANKSFTEIFKVEKPILYPAKPAFECSEISQAKVDKYSTITYKSSRYSVPDNMVGKMVTIRAFPDKILISNNDENLCTHNRRTGLFEWSINLEHYIRTLKRKPGALASSVALKQTASELQEIYEKYFKKREKEFIEILDYTYKKNMSSEKLNSLIEYLKPKEKNDITLDKIKIIYERDSTPVEQNFCLNKTNEIDFICNNQLKLLSQLIPDSNNLNSEVMEVL